MPLSLFLQSKEKKMHGKTKKIYLFNAEAIIKQASRSKCFYFSHSFYTKIFHGPLKWKCISLSLQERSEVGLNNNNNNNDNNKQIFLDCNQTSKVFPERCSSKGVFCKHAVNLQERAHAKV